MAIDVKPLFRPEAIRPHLAKFHDPDRLELAGTKLANWAKLLASKAGANKKETELLGEFLRDVFVDALGYVPPPADPYTIKREALVEVDGKFADAALGRFEGESARCVVMLEGKGPKDPLDRPHAGRKRSAVEQALQYAVQERTDWYIVTNLVETRLYHKGNNTFTFEAFETSRMAKDEAELKRFVFQLGAERVLAVGGNHLDRLLTESTKIGRELTNQFYGEYRSLREQTFNMLRRENPDRNPTDLLAATQKILDRVLFIAFCEDRGLLPREIIARAYQHSDPFNPRPVWRNFVSLFHAVDAGNAALNVWKYNGGLFAKDEFLDSLVVPDEVCHGFKKLAEYEYGQSADTDAKLIDVEILGHIFEQSITDLEELHRAIAKNELDIPHRSEPSKRKREGAFYTPDFVTRYIVKETLGPVVRERFEAFRQRAEAAAGQKVKGFKALLADPAAFDPDKLTKPQQGALAKFWESWLEELETIRIVDPSCGSGAFLVQAYDQMFAEYATAQGYITSLKGSSLFDIKRAVLTHNIFGMDLNSEAVEIARLSSWIKTAEYGKVLTSLDGNIVQGNSVVAEPDPVTHWSKTFPAAFADGGFDVVIGNPPYVRQSLIKNDMPFYKRHYSTFDGMADLYVYFYELGMTILRPGGRLGFISSNSFLRANYGEKLRDFLTSVVQTEQIIEMGDNQVFADAKDVCPVIIICSKRKPHADALVKCAKFQRNDSIERIGETISKLCLSIPLSNLSADGWQLENAQIAAIRKKMSANSVPLGELLKGGIFRGVVTGLNEAFIVDSPTRDRLVSQHHSSEKVLYKFIRGQDIDRWHTEWAGEWIIFMRRGIEVEEFPAVQQYLSPFRLQLEPRPVDFTGSTWPGRKAGAYRWFELQDPVDYWNEFLKPKIIYPDIAKSGEFCLEKIVAHWSKYNIYAAVG